MNIHESIGKIKYWIMGKANPIFIFAVIFLGAMAIFGFIVSRQQPKFQIQVQQLQLADVQNATVSAPIVIVGNKTSKIYHLEDCPGALKMRQDNKVFFDSVAAAVGAGYRAAKNCPSLEYLK